jgi:hypothetical protein
MISFEYEMIKARLSDLGDMLHYEDDAVRQAKIASDIVDYVDLIGTWHLLKILREADRRRARSAERLGMAPL